MKRNKILYFALLVLLLLPSTAYCYSQEIAKATPYYIHPVTGVIEDAGNNPGIGQGMTENVLHPQALVEEVDGRYFLSVRYNLANYIKNETFAVQNRGDDSFYSVPYEVTAQTAETKDYRFEIPSKNVIVRATFFVGPMGRDVVFYYDLSNFTPGNTDFVALDQASQQNSAKDAQGDANEEASQAPVAPSAPSAPAAPTAPNLPAAQKITPPATGSQPMPSAGAKVETQAVNSKMSAGDLGYTHGLLMKNSPILKKVYGEDSQGEEKEKKVEKAPLGPVTKGFIYMFLALIAFVTMLLMILAIASKLYAKKLIEENDIRREKYYEKD